MQIYDTLQPWQKRYVKAFHEHKRMVSVCGRQIGKSWVASFCCIEDAILNGASWALVSTCQRSADELFRKCVKMATFFKGMLQGTRLSFEFTNNASEIRFSNGSRIVCYPNSPDTIRGGSFSLCLDEFAFFDNPDEMWSAIIPMLTSPYGFEKKIQIISTPAGKSGRFYNLLTTDNDYFKTKVTLEDAVREGLKVDVEEIKRTCIDSDVYRQEYMCEFLDSNTALFSYDLLNSCKYEICPEGDYFLGIDIGRHSDRTAIAILMKSGNKKFIKEVQTLQNTEFDEQFRKISNIIESLKPVKVCIDSTGLGMQIAEQLKKKYGIVEPVTFTNQSKNEMFGNAKKDFGTKNLFIPDDPHVIEELHSVKRIVSSNGNLSYQADRNENGHADRACAIVLANRAATNSTAYFEPIAF